MNITAQIQMLPTDEYSILIKHPSELKLYKQPMNKVSNGLAIPQFLYITTINSKIVKGDWYLYWCIDKWEIMHCQDEEEADRCNNHFFIHPHCKKILASTNPDISLPNIDKEFIEKYCKSQGTIEEVLVNEILWFNLNYDGFVVPVIPPSMQVPLDFVLWYSGMDKEKVLKAYERWQNEKL